MSLSTHQHGLTEVIDVEHLRRQRIAPVVALTRPGIEMHSHAATLRELRRRRKFFLHPLGNTDGGSSVVADDHQIRRRR